MGIPPAHVGDGGGSLVSSAFSSGIDADSADGPPIAVYVMNVEWSHQDLKIPMVKAMPGVKVRVVSLQGVARLVSEIVDPEVF